MRNEFRIVAETENRLTCHTPQQVVPIREERTREDEKRAFELARRTIAVFNDWLSHDKADDRDTMSVIGSHLYGLLFVGDIDVAFREVWRRRIGEADPKPLRIVVEFQEEAAWLAELPWEFLYLPDAPGEPEGFFLSAQDGVILTRTVQQTSPDRGEPNQDDPIRILVILSQPKLEDHVSDALAKVLAGLSDVHPKRIELRTHLREGREPGVPGPTRQDLAAWIGDRESPPDIVHFLGHGAYEYNRETRLERGALALVTPDSNESDWCSDKDFAGFFDPARLPKLVFLHACESGTTASYRGFKGLALSLIKRGVPNVVAMQYPVNNELATSFASTFYEAALNGVPIDAAVQAGRQVLGTSLTRLAAPLKPNSHYSDRRFGSPIVFVQAWQGLSVFGRGADANDAQAAARLPVSDDLPCPYPSCKSFHKRFARFCDQGYGPLHTCEKCENLMREEALACSQCGTRRTTGTGAAVRAVLSSEAVVEAPRVAVDRFRASAESSPTHGGSGFPRRPDG
jgi:RNA polymerase subunit RPABC4/transcription elongation factor Spt4